MTQLRLPAEHREPPARMEFDDQSEIKVVSSVEVIDNVRRQCSAGCRAFKLPYKETWSVFKLLRREKKLKKPKLPSKDILSAFKLHCEKKLKNLMVFAESRRILSSGKIEDGQWAATNFIGREGRGGEEEEEEEFWRKRILIGAHCQLSDFEGAMCYVERENQLIMIKRSQLPTETLGLNFHLGVEWCGRPQKK